MPSAPPDEPAIAVIVADAQRLVREGLRALLESEGDIVVVGEASRGEHAVAETRRRQPDVVLMDIGVPGIDALHASRLIFDEGRARARVLLLATRANDAEVLAAVRAGAYGVLQRDSTPEHLRRAARRIAAGHALLTPGVTRRLATELVAGRVHDDIVPPELEALTGREREVLGLVGHGLGNAEIAARLAVSPATVKAHVGAAIAKLQARDRAALVVLAYETGLLRPAARPTAPLVRPSRPRPAR